MCIVSLIVDGWEDIEGRPIHGVIVCCWGMIYYLNSYDITKDGKFKIDLVIIWRQEIKEVNHNLDLL